MSRSDGPGLVAIGIDAAEPTLVRRLAERGDLPVLRGLLAEGVWGRVASPTPIGSGAIWPTFQTGHGPAQHGLYGEWAWQPDAMRLTRPSYEHLEPFWRLDASRGRRVTVIDVPFAPRLGVPGCVEVFDWGSHDLPGGRPHVAPRDLEALVVEAGGVHPFVAGPVTAAGPRDHAGLTWVVDRCLAGVEQRGRLAGRLLAETAPDLLIVVFTEVHRAGHLLWHAVDSHQEGGDGAAPARGLPDLLAGVDREIGRLRDLAGPERAMVVFSLHGMRPARGIPTILGPLLEAHGFAVRRRWRERSLAERAASALTRVKQAVPDPVKRLYHRSMPPTVTGMLTQPSMPMPPYDWARTAAFALPTDQHGWVRVNLRGREAQGIVEPAGYDDLCRRLEAMLRGARLEDGRPLVRATVRTAEDGAAAVASPLPDLVVHWDDATFVSPVRVAAPRVAAPSVGLQFTGQHAPQGFYLVRPRRGGPRPDGATVPAERLQHLFRAAAGWPD
jgi:predicted AlkP superfamily phosphohydrolase/phosphomutase